MPPAVDNECAPEAMISREKLEAWLSVCGVASGFIDFTGCYVQTPLVNRVNILRALGRMPDSEAVLEQWLESHEKSRWQRWVPPVLVLAPGENQVGLASLEEESADYLAWRLCDESGQQRQGNLSAADFPMVEEYLLDGRRWRRHMVTLPVLEPGYYELVLESGQRLESSFLVVSPERCHEAPWARDGQRIWGMAAQLYTLRSDTNWGIGDFSDLLGLIDEAAVVGADFILLNPLHALDFNYPENCSPYSPTDRRFLNPLYLDPGVEQDFLQSRDISHWHSTSIAARREALRDLAEVDYPAVFRLKFAAFAAMYRHFTENHLRHDSLRARRFREFVDGSGEALRNFANFHAALDLPHVEFAADPQFHQYLQWLAQGELATCQAHAKARGMKLGLIRDLAVGGGSDSCEVATNPDLFCLGARIGAPPDHFNPDGQNWGLPPLHPQALEQSRFAHFIQLLRTNMLHCGALRIDHVMALMRLWWCPLDGTNAAGAYVHYPVDVLFAILRLESQRAGCMVIGEDLGVVPPEIRSHIHDSAVYSNIMFYFEKYDVLRFKRPSDYTVKALAIIANHDVPPLLAWWETRDLVLRHRLGLIADEVALANETAHREREKAALLDWLQGMGRLPESWHDKQTGRAFDEDLAAAIMGACATASSQLLSVQLDDLLLMADPVNIPGTSKEYGNWRRKLRMSARQAFARPQLQSMLRGVREQRP